MKFGLVLLSLALFACEPAVTDRPPDDERVDPVEEPGEGEEEPGEGEDEPPDERVIAPSPFPVGERVPPAPTERVEVEALPAIECSAACEVVDTEAKEALCYNCRCKREMEGWMPSPDQMQCGLGERLVMYDDEGGIADVSEEQNCQNSSLFQFDCGDASRYGSVSRGAVTYRWLCRKMWAPGFDFPEYDLTGIIAVNEDSGATCYWDAAGAVIDDDGMPDFDLMNQPEEASELFAQNFYRTYGEGCVMCHDNDGFIYTPFLKSARFPTGNWTQAPYFLLSPFEDGRVATGIYQLENRNAASCIDCHRISSGLTCGTLARHALGDTREPPLTFYDPESESLVEEVGLLSTPFIYTPNLWMPDDVNRFESIENYDGEFARSRDAILDCCGGATRDRFGASCNWSPIPVR